MLNSHPIQYFAPLYRRLAQESDIDMTVYYLSRAGLDVYADPGFGGETFSWDVPLIDGYRHVFLPNLRGDRSPDGFWSLVNPAIVRELLRERYDAVWIHGHAYAANLLGVLAARIAGSALFMRCETHLDLHRSTLRRAARRLVMRRFYQLFDACLAIGTRNAEFYRHHGVPESRVFSVPYSVDDRRFEAGARLSPADRARTRERLQLPRASVPLVLFLSKLTPVKRPIDLVRAFKRLRQQGGPRAGLAFVGTGPEQERLRGIVEGENLPDVFFLGFRNQSELPAIYGACDVFVLPSEDEPWGLVINEAMSAGLPVVVTDRVGAGADLVRDGYNGFVYPAGDVEALADCLGLLLGSPELRVRMGKASLSVIRRWGLEASVQGLKRALRARCGGSDVLAALRESG